MKSNLAQYLYDHLKSNRGRVVALSEYREKTVSWQQVLEYSLKFGSFLKQQGISGGDKILLKGENILERVVYSLAILQGVAVVPIDSRPGRGFIRRIQKKVKVAYKIGVEVFCHHSGGAYLEPAVDQFWRGLAYALFQGYGLTETMNTTPLSRTYGFKQSMENIGRLLDRGWSIIIFPEGRVTPDGKIKSF